MHNNNEIKFNLLSSKLEYDKLFNEILQLSPTLEAEAIAKEIRKNLIC